MMRHHLALPSVVSPVWSGMLLNVLILAVFLGLMYLHYKFDHDMVEMARSRLSGEQFERWLLNHYWTHLN